MRITTQVSASVMVYLTLLRGITSFANPTALSRVAFSTSRTVLVMSTKVPSAEELSTAPFMEQVSHSGKLVSWLSTYSSPREENELTDLLTAQLSHSDGIRGFFVTYLTGEGSTPADEPEVPDPLASAMRKANQDDLIPLVCMNVIMPTAMTTMHKDPELSAQSAKTAERGKRILKSLKDNPEVKRNCNAIQAAATGNSVGSDKELVEYWEKFFKNYGYEKQQKADIAKAVSDVA